MAEHIVFYCDGLVEPTNPGGWCCWAWVAIAPDGTEVASDYGCLGRGPNLTNNVAEYVAAGKALRWAADNGHRGVVLKADSKLVINQALGAWACNAPHLRRLCNRLQELVRETSATLQWIPRTENARADALSRRAYREARRSGR